MDSYTISVCGNAVYALNALFCAHWAFNVDYFSRLQPFYNFIKVNLFGKKTDVFDFVDFGCQKCLFILAVFLQLDYSLMFHYSNFVLPNFALFEFCA